MFRESRLAEWLTTVARVSSSSLILEDAAGRALIVKATYKRHWTFPGGVIDVGETPAQAAVRETHEEVGVEVDPTTVSFGWIANRTSQIADTYQFVFRANLPVGAEAFIQLQTEEIEDYVFVSKEDVLRGGRDYGKVIEHWANGISGYVEQTFGATE